MVAKFKKIKKGQRQSLFFPLLLGLLVFILVSLLVVANWKIGRRKSELNSQIEVLKQQIQTLESERGQLQAQISQTEKEDYLEEEARERFNLKKPGEEVVAIVPPEEEKEEERGFWQKIWEKIRF